MFEHKGLQRTFYQLLPFPINSSVNASPWKVLPSIKIWEWGFMYRKVV